MMEFQKASDRLNFFFSQHSWALLVDMPSDSSLDKHLQVLRTASRHWGSKLEFPFQFNATAFENTHEAHEYWMEKIPRLRLLHSRKQEIIIKDLYDGYDAQRANQLLRRKMKLDESAWGHLIYFGGPRRTFICTFQTMPEPQALRDAVAKFHENHVAESILKLETVQSSDAIAFGAQYEMSDLSALNTQIFIDANNSDSAVRLKQSVSSKYPMRISLNYSNCSIEFKDWDIIVKLTPLCFAIYYMYLEVPQGFKNVNRKTYIDKAHHQYFGYWGTLANENARRIFENCFNTSNPDDKPFRDVIYKIKIAFIDALKIDDDLTKLYYVTGKSGDVKRIKIPREFVNN